MVLLGCPRPVLAQLSVSVELTWLPGCFFAINVAESLCLAEGRCAAIQLEFFFAEDHL